MSCFIVSPETVGIVAQAITDALDKDRAPWYDIKIDRRPWNACKVCRFDIYHDTEMIYNMLYAENFTAYNSQYRETGGGWPPYTYKRRDWTTADLIELYKRGSCYLYQITEDATLNGDIYKAVKSILDTVAGHVVMELAKNIEWG